jgi:hypothetical protein
LTDDRRKHDFTLKLHAKQFREHLLGTLYRMLEEQGNMG